MRFTITIPFKKKDYKTVMDKPMLLQKMIC